MLMKQNKQTNKHQMQYKYSSLPVEMKLEKPSSKAWIAKDFSAFLCIKAKLAY